MPCRVVQVSSRLEKWSQLNAELLEGIGRGEVGDHAYADSKRALMLWTSTRAQSLAFKGGLYCHCSTPGMVDTELGRYSVSPWLWPLTKPLRMLLLRSPAEGALAAVAGGLLPQATTRFGRYMDGEVQLEDLVLSRMGEKALATDLVKWASKATALEQRADGYDR
ncbi:RDH14 [Symbiodinium sp. KB8]|nr:RDH14 [Symbiodinium sp. KB8]